ncbi:MAG: ferrochelatase, partial [Planctomycetota bacterium]
EQVGEGAPAVDLVRKSYNHPGFVEVYAESVRQCLEQIPAGRRQRAANAFTAHSIPMAMADNCNYEKQLRESARLVAEAAGHERWELVYQSRSGPPQQPWLEPDICDWIEERHGAGELDDLIILPIGFVSDHMEVMFDLDTEAKELCEKLGVSMQRAATAGTHPRFVSMIRELLVERIEGWSERPALGDFGPSHDVCPADCCTYTPRRPAGRPAGRPGP